MENWTYSLFFLVAELWGAVVISVLFWTLANEVCTVKEAKTIYPLMGIAANVALVAAGNFMKLVSRGLAVSAFLSCTPCTVVYRIHPFCHPDVVCELPKAPLRRHSNEHAASASQHQCSPHKTFATSICSVCWRCCALTGLLFVQSELMCLRVLMATVMVLTAVIFGTEIWVENRIAVDSYIEPAGAAKKKKVPRSPARVRPQKGCERLLSTTPRKLAVLLLTVTAPDEPFLPDRPQ